MRRVVSLLALVVMVLTAGVASAQSAVTTKAWTSPDGALRFRYPASWYVIDDWPADPGVKVQNVAPVGRSVGKGEFFVIFWREARSEGTTVASLRARDCSNDSADIKVLSCETVTINGWSWSWVNTVVTGSVEGKGERSRLIATVANGWVYRGAGLAPAGSLQAKGLAETKTILESVVINGSKLPATGLDDSALWLGALLLLTGYALKRAARKPCPARLQ